MAAFEAQAYEATRALKTADAGPLGMAVGALVGVIGGPAGVLAGAAGGTAIGSLLDLFGYGVGADFISKAATDLGPDKTAVVAEIDEKWSAPLEVRMEPFGGTVLRTLRADFEDEQMAKEAAVRKAEWEELRAEYEQASAVTKAKVKARLDGAKADLAKAQERLTAKLDSLQGEVRAKVATLEKQVATAQADARERIKQLIAALRAERETRSAKLKQAWDLTKEALTS